MKHGGLLEDKKVEIDLVRLVLSQEAREYPNLVTLGNLLNSRLLQGSKCAFGIYFCWVLEMNSNYLMFGSGWNYQGIYKGGAFAKSCPNRQGGEAKTSEGKEAEG